MNPEEFDRKIQRFFAEDDLSAKINRTFLGLEMRITLDHFLNNKGAKLVSSREREIDVHPATVKRYWELQSLIYDYIKSYGSNPQIEEIKNKWTTPARSRYFN
jgi:hypothetical protein